jgi:hypothetical protein
LEREERQRKADGSSYTDSHENLILSISRTRAAKQERLSERKYSEKDKVHGELSADTFAACQCNHCHNQNAQGDPHHF